MHCDRWKGRKLITVEKVCLASLASIKNIQKLLQTKVFHFLRLPTNRKIASQHLQCLLHTTRSWSQCCPKNQVRVCTHENPSLCKCTLSVALESSNCPGSCKPACSSERDAFCSCLMNVLRAIEVHKRQKKMQKQEGIHKQAAKPCCAASAADAFVEVHLHSLRAKPLSSCQLPSSLTAQSKPTYAIMPYQALRAAHLDLILSLWANRAYFSENLSTTSSWVRYSSGS